MLRRPRTALVGAAACLAGLVATGVLAELVPAAHVRDSASLRGFASLRDLWISSVLERIAHVADGAPYALLGAALVVAALVRERRRVALAVGAVLLAAPATAEVLKHLLAAPRSTGVVDGHITAASWPSGHATAAMTLALCGVLVAPPRFRPAAAAVGGLFTIAVSYAVLVWVWHFPSDVVGGLLVAAVYALLAVAFLRRWPAPAEPPPSPLAWPAVAVGIAGAGAAAAFASDHLLGRTSFVVAAVTIAALAVGLAAAVSAAATRRAPRGARTRSPRGSPRG